MKKFILRGTLFLSTISLQAGYFDDIWKYLHANQHAVTGEINQQAITQATDDFCDVFTSILKNYFAKPHMTFAAPNEEAFKRDESKKYPILLTPEIFQQFIKEDNEQFLLIEPNCDSEEFEEQGSINSTIVSLKGMTYEIMSNIYAKRHNQSYKDVLSTLVTRLDQMLIFHQQRDENIILDYLGTLGRGYVLHMSFALRIFSLFLENPHLDDNDIYTLLQNFTYLKISSGGVVCHFSEKRRNKYLPFPKVDIQMPKEYEELRTYINFAFSVLGSFEGDAQYRSDMARFLIVLKDKIQTYTTGWLEELSFYDPPHIQVPAPQHSTSSSAGYTMLWIPFKQSTLGLIGLGVTAATGAATLLKNNLTLSHTKLSSTQRAALQQDRKVADFPGLQQIVQRESSTHDKE